MVLESLTMFWAKGEGIIKIRVQEVKVEHKPNFGNAFTHKLLTMPKIEATFREQSFNAFHKILKKKEQNISET